MSNDTPLLLRLITWVVYGAFILLGIFLGITAMYIILFELVPVLIKEVWL